MPYLSIILRILSASLIFSALLNESQAGREPYWVRIMPMDPCYFFGRARILRTDDQEADLVRARKEAMEFIKQQIVISISSEEEFRVTSGAKEWNGIFLKRVIDKIPGFEIINYEQVSGPYFSSNYIHVLYRLEKAKYYERLYGELWHSSEQATEFYNKGVGSVNLAEAYNSYITALSYLEPVQGANVSFKICGEFRSISTARIIGGKVKDLDKAVMAKLKDLVEDVKITSSQKGLIFTGDNPGECDLKITVLKQGKAVIDFPMELLVADTSWKFKTPVTTDKNGEAEFKLLESGFPGEKPVKIRPVNSSGLDLMKLYDLPLPSLNIMLHRTVPSVYLDIKEYNMGKPSEVYIKALMKSLNQDGYISFAQKHAADVIVSGTVNSLENGLENRLKRALIQVDLALTPQQGSPAEFKRTAGKGLDISTMRAAGADGLKREGARNARDIVQSIMILMMTE